MKFMDKPYRNLIREVAYSQYAVRDQNSILGLLWSFLNPLLMMAVLFAYFRFNAGRDVKHYPVFLLLGMVHYTHFSNTTTSAMNVLTSMAQLTRHTILPKEALVIGSVLASSVDFGVSMLVCLVLACLSGIPATRAMLGLPLIVLLQLMFVMWVSFLLSAARAFVKDLSHIYQVVLRLLFFTTPIFYATAFLRSSLAQQMVRFNPLAHLIGFSRTSIIDGEMFPVKVFLALVAINALALWGALRWFKRCEPSFAEYV
jgi:ABC-type polysaccharide/polyol phosphate export permease